MLMKKKNETPMQRVWRRWLGRRIPSSRSTLLQQRHIFILPSRQGALFLLIALVVFIGGINYANSLILAIAFLMISLFIVGILHTYANLSGLRISAGKTENGFLGETAYFEVVLSRDTHKRTYHAINLRWSGEYEQLSSPVDLIASQSDTQWLALTGHQRGVLKPPRLRVESRYPLGLLKAWTSIQLDQQCFVYPTPIATEFAQSSTGDEGEGQVVVGNNDFDSLRAYVAGDNTRHIAWKHYARGAGLQSKMFVDHASDERLLEWNSFSHLDTEQRLSAICYWVLFFSQKQVPFSLCLPGLFLAESTGDVHRQRCLEVLALFTLEPKGGMNG